jgi:hypothetical protein
MDALLLHAKQAWSQSYGFELQRQRCKKFTRN